MQCVIGTPDTTEWMSGSYWIINTVHIRKASTRPCMALFLKIIFSSKVQEFFWILILVQRAVRQNRSLCVTEFQIHEIWMLWLRDQGCQPRGCYGLLALDTPLSLHPPTSLTVPRGHWMNYFHKIFFITFWPVLKNNTLNSQISKLLFSEK